MDTAIDTLALDVKALDSIIHARFETGLGVSPHIWEARQAVQTELTRLRKERDALANAELKAAWRNVLVHEGL